MPQLDPSVFATQLFWLAILFGFLYFVVIKSTLPKLDGVVTKREQSIQGDLDAADAAQAAAQKAETELEEKLQAARSSAGSLTAAAKSTTQQNIDAALKARDAELAAMIDAAETAIVKAKAKAVANIQSASAGHAADIVSKLTGIKLTAEEAAKYLAK